MTATPTTGPRTSTFLRVVALAIFIVGIVMLFAKNPFNLRDVLAAYGIAFAVWLLSTVVP